MALQCPQWTWFDPYTGEVIGEHVEPGVTPPGVRRSGARKRRPPAAAKRLKEAIAHIGDPGSLPPRDENYDPGPPSNISGPRRERRDILSGRSMHALFAKAMSPPEGVPRGEFAAVEVKRPIAKAEIADAQSRQVNHRYLRWKLCGDCAMPRKVIWQSGAHLKGRMPLREDLFPERTAELDVRCRRCPPCLQARRRKWAAYAKRELLAAKRTWMVTFTLNDWALSFLKARAIKHFNERGKAPRAEMVGSGGTKLVKYWLDPPASFEELPADEQYILLEREMFREFMLMVMRMRKTCRETKGQEFRYLLVSERNSSGERGEKGNPHFHAFFHQISDSDLTARMFDDAPDHRSVKVEDKFNPQTEWKVRPLPDEGHTGGRGRHKSVWRRLGHVERHLVDADAISPNYVVKYLAKDMCAKVRSSRYYGRLDDRARKLQALDQSPDLFDELPDGQLGREEVRDRAHSLIDPDDVGAAVVRSRAGRLVDDQEADRGLELTHRDREDAARAARSLRELREAEGTAETRTRWLRSGGRGRQAVKYRKAREGPDGGYRGDVVDGLGPRRHVRRRGPER